MAPERGVGASADGARVGVAAGTSGPATAAPQDIELTILMPCQNEAETLRKCVEGATAFLGRARIAGEVLVADNGSTGGSQQIAEEAGAREGLVPAHRGLASLGGILRAEVGLLLAILGIVLSLAAVGEWSAQSFGPLGPSRVLRLVIPGALSLSLGVEVVLASFFLGILQLPPRRPPS